jgi:hypothetical protein
MLLRGLSRIIREETKARLHPGQTLIDMGCGDMSYRQLIEQHGLDYRGADLEGTGLRIGPDGMVELPIEVSITPAVMRMDDSCIYWARARPA